MVLTGNSSRPKAENWFGDRTDLGMLQSPATWRTPWCSYACDNDCFARRDDAGWWEREGEARWLKMLDKIPPDKPPLFVLLPDVPFDWPESVYRAWRYVDEVRTRNLPFAIALQDGPVEQVLQAATAIGYPPWLFVGGSVPWKWGNARRIVEYGHLLGMKVHVGRAGGNRRIRWCLDMGADSCDGSKWLAFADAMMPGLLRTLDTDGQQTSLFGEATA